MKRFTGLILGLMLSFVVVFDERGNPHFFYVPQGQRNPFIMHDLERGNTYFGYRGSKNNLVIMPLFEDDNKGLKDRRKWNAW